MVPIFKIRVRKLPTILAGGVSFCAHAISGKQADGRYLAAAGLGKTRGGAAKKAAQSFGKLLKR